MTGERPMHPPEPLGVRMALARDEKGMKQADLAARARELGLGRIQQGRISSWERGAAIPVDAVEILARALDVDPGWLSHGVATAAPAPKWWQGDGAAGTLRPGDLKPAKGPSPIRTRVTPAKGRRTG